jgi:hypothetical protein
MEPTKEGKKKKEAERKRENNEQQKDKGKRRRKKINKQIATKSDKEIRNAKTKKEALKKDRGRRDKDKTVVAGNVPPAAPRPKIGYNDRGRRDAT